MITRLKRVPASNSPLKEGCPQDGVSFLDTQSGNTLHEANQQNIVSRKITTPTLHHPSKEIEISTKRIKYLDINGIILNLNPILDLPYNPILKERARKLRQARNLSEVLFWKQVTKGSFYKIVFDRQRVIGNYIVDFYIKQLGLVIEIDGSSHIDKEEYDSNREKYLISLGLKVYQITVGGILNNMTSTMNELEEFIIKNCGK